MTRILARFLALLCLALGFAAPALAASKAPPLRVMTFNVRVPVATDGPEAWPNRRDVFIDTIRKADPDIFGTQELKQEQGDYVIQKLPHYAWFGIDRRGDHSDEHMGIFYRRDRLKLLDLGNFWLSDTPTVPGSITWGNPYPRMVTWGLFEDKATGRQFYFFNTHFPYREQDDVARLKSAQVLMDHLTARVGDTPVVLTGDFNTTPDSDAYALIARTLTDVRKAAPTVLGPDKTFHNFTGTPDRRIDWIFERGFTPLSDETVTTHRGKLYPSDHFPVLAVLGWGD